MEKLVTKAELHSQDEQNFSHPTGDMKRQLTSSELVKNPQKHFRTFGVHLRNRKKIEHEISTRMIPKRKLGGKNILKSNKAKNGVTYTFIQGIPRKGKKR